VAGVPRGGAAAADPGHHGGADHSMRARADTSHEGRRQSAGHPLQRASRRPLCVVPLQPSSAAGGKTATAWSSNPAAPHSNLHWMLRTHEPSYRRGAALRTACHGLCASGVCAHVMSLSAKGASTPQDDPMYEGADAITEEDVAWAAAEQQMLLEVCDAWLNSRRYPDIVSEYQHAMRPGFAMPCRCPPVLCYLPKPVLGTPVYSICLQVESQHQGPVVAPCLEHELLRPESHSMVRGMRGVLSTEYYGTGIDPRVWLQVDGEDGGWSWQWELQDQGGVGRLIDGIAGLANAVWGPEPKAFIPAVRCQLGRCKQIHTAPAKHPSACA